MSKTRELGTLDGPVLLFGGPYGNLQATRALLKAARAWRIPPARIICTGDLVAYCADPRPTVDLIREAGIPVVMGNCEESLGQDSEDCGCGFEEGSACDLLAVRWYAHARAELDPDAKAWMRGLPRRITFTLGGRRLAVVHGGVASINRFLFPGSPDADLHEEMALAGTDGVIAGHSGLPFTRYLGGRLWINAGVIGLPVNDGTPRVWCALMTPTADHLVITHHALFYDHEAAAQAIRDAGLPEDYAEALQSGLWPDDGIMPRADRARRGQALDPTPFLWPYREPLAESA